MMRFIALFLLLTLPLSGFGTVVAPGQYTGVGVPGATGTQGGAGTSSSFVVTNSDNSAAAGHAYLEAAVGGTTSTGDPHLRLTIPGGTSWYVGVDNSQTDIFFIGTGTAVGTTPALSLASATGAARFGTTSMRLGTGAAAGTNNAIHHETVDTGSTEVSGGFNTDNGANVKVYGPNHATKASITEFRAGSTINGSISAAGLWTIGTGTATTHVLNTQLATNAADALTMLNGPSGKAGNPAVYIAITVNGSARVIPAW